MNELSPTQLSVAFIAGLGTLFLGIQMEVYGLFTFFAAIGVAVSLGFFMRARDADLERRRRIIAKKKP